MNLIFGTGGFAKEVEWLIYDIYAKAGLDYRVNFFVAKNEDELFASSSIDKPVITENEAFSRYRNTALNAFIAVANPETKRKVVEKIKINLQQCTFPNLIHPDVTYDNRFGKIIMGEGNIICAKNVLTTNIALRNFVHINLGCTIGHDSVIEDCSTLSPGVHVSGNVFISNDVFIGTGATILEKISICYNTIIGAGAVVTDNINTPGVYVGIPSQKRK